MCVNSRTESPCLLGGATEAAKVSLFHAAKYSGFALECQVLCWEISKQHLRIKQFYGTSENAVKTQIWIAVSVYVLVAIVKKQLGLEASLYRLMQVHSVTIFEKCRCRLHCRRTSPKAIL